MKTKLDELLEKWRFTASVYHGGMTHEIVTDLEAIKSSLNDPVDDMHQAGREIATKLMFKDSLKPSLQKEKEKCLEAWMHGVIEILEHNVSISDSHRENLYATFTAYRKSIGIS